MLTLLALLLVGHALADYPLQGDFLARAKNERAPIPGVPWWQAMTAHCVIHAGMVLMITAIWWLAALEFVIHFVTDRLKCRGQISFNTDQAIHVACKVMWAALAWHVAGFAGLTA
jgi:hypothetical protein